MTALLDERLRVLAKQTDTLELMRVHRPRLQNQTEGDNQ